MHTKVSHAGTVESVGKGCVRVRILQASACASCKVAGHCNASESKEKIVDVLNVGDTSGLNVGDNVVVYASRDVAGRALLLGFGIPLLILFSVLLTVVCLTAEEGVAAIVALLALALYYGVLYLFRNRIRQGLSFHLEQI